MRFKATRRLRRVALKSPSPFSMKRDLRDLPWLLILRFSPSRVICGIDVRVFESEDDAAAIFAKASNAIDLIAEYDAKSLLRLQRHLKHILFTLASGGQYLPRIEICRISTAYALRTSTLELSMMIVHESTHARLWRIGCRYSENEREYIERKCVEAEIAFASRVPGSNDAIEQAKTLLATQWWTHEAIAQSTSEVLRKLGCPRWVIRLLRVEH